MQNDEKLSLDLVWEAGGHLTEIALTVLGDGEAALLPGSALEHAAACPRCSAGLGQAALLSLRTGEALRGLQASGEAPAPAPPPPGRLPVPALVAALSLSAFGAAPALLAEAGRAQESLATCRLVLSVVFRAGRAAIESGAFNRLHTALSWLSAMFLVIAGLGVARVMGKQLSLKGGV